MVFVTDTHALLWAQSNQRRRLGRLARRAFEQADQGLAHIYIPVATLLEFEWMETRGRLQLGPTLEDWVRQMAASRCYELVPLTPAIVLRSRKFRGLESMDRLIVATAEELDCPLITADTTIHERRPVTIVWD